jgi:pimeloyl-ACP methyl ester carboxylesterase
VPTIRDVELALTDRGSGPAFFWGHGLTGSTAQDGRNSMFDWDRLARRRRILRWDARGHGESAGTLAVDEYRWDNLALDLLALADVLGVERFVAGGVSMGAATALHAAVAAPERIDALVLVLAPTAYETRADQAKQYRDGAALIEKRGVGAYVARASAEPVPDILRSVADLYRFVPAVEETRLPAVLRGAAASDLPSPDAVRRVSQPALLLAWETDRGHPVSTSQRLVELLPHAELVVARRLRELASWTDRVESFLDSVAA